MTKTNVLLVEDDVNLGTVLKEFLNIKGFNVVHAENGEEGLQKFNEVKPDLIILDIMMPKLDGFSTAKIIRKENASVPIIFLSAKSMQEDKIEGLKIGADDYLTKPFSTEELLLRMQAILKRTGSTNPLRDEYKIGKYTFSYKNRSLMYNKVGQKLTSKESELLLLLCINVNNTLNRSEALTKIWHDDSYFTSRSMDVFITKLRGYLKEDKAVEIVNVHSTGYKLITP